MSQIQYHNLMMVLCLTASNVTKSKIAEGFFIALSAMHFFMAIVLTVASLVAK